MGKAAAYTNPQLTGETVLKQRSLWLMCVRTWIVCKHYLRLNVTGPNTLVIVSLFFIASWRTSSTLSSVRLVLLKMLFTVATTLPALQNYREDVFKKLCFCKVVKYLPSYLYTYSSLVTSDRTYPG